MIVAVVILALLALALCIIVLLYRSELIRWSLFLKNHPPTSNTRLGTEAPLPASRDVVYGINELLDEASAREHALRDQERELLEGLAGLSHDIRTPLAGAKGYVQLAKGEEDPNERLRCLELAEGRLNATQEMVDMLFDYMRITTDRDAFDIERCDVVEILSRSLMEHHEAIVRKGWECQLDLSGELFAMVDEVALRRVFDNIIGNMLKHGLGDMSIQRFGNTLLFSNPIEDGSDVDLSRVFDRFYRGESARSTDGAGLGLAAVKQLCDFMGIIPTTKLQDDYFSIQLTFTPT